MRHIAEWAAAKGYADRIEALGFIDGGVSLDCGSAAGCRGGEPAGQRFAQTLRAKLRRTPEGHLRHARPRSLGPSHGGMKVNIYLEDWSTACCIQSGRDARRAGRRPCRRFMCL